MSTQPTQSKPGVNPGCLKGCLGAIFLFVILALVLSLVPGDSEKSTTGVPPRPAVKAAAAKPAVPQFNKKSIADLVNKTLGPCNRDGVKRFREVSIYPMHDKLCSIQVEFSADDNLSTNLTRQGMLEDMGKVSSAMWKVYPDLIGEMACVAFAEMRDRYGRTSEEPVASLTFYRATLKKVQFANLFGDDLVNAADEYFVHPALRE